MEKINLFDILKRSNHSETCLNLEPEVKGFYTLVIRDAETKEIKRQYEPFENMITDLGLNSLGTGLSISYGYVGTGTNPADVTDTTMGVFKVRSSNTTTESVAPSAPRYYYTVIQTFRYNAGTINGNITEVGCGWNPSPVGALWSRELIVDSSGNPITITVLANEILDVIYTLRYYPPGISDFTGSFTLNSVTYNYTARLQEATQSFIILGYAAGGPSIQNVYAAGSTLGPITGSPTGSSAGSGTVTYLPYVNNSLKASARSDFSLTQGNVAGGIRIFTTALNQGGGKFFRTSHQWLLDKPIPKTNANTMSFTMEIGWSRYTGPL